MTTDTHVRSSTNGQDQRSDADRWLDLTSADDDRAWQARTRVVLQPIAAPSIMGLFGFMLATVMVGAWQAGWYGDITSPLIIPSEASTPPSPSGSSA